MDTSELAAVYQWQYRPQSPRRPAWFTAWPGGARMAVGIIVLHEWESVPRPIRPMPAGAHHTFDFLSLGAREYGARHGIWRLLDVLDRRQVKATVICSGLVAELFPASIREAQARGHEIATHQYDQAIHPPLYKTKEEERDYLRRALDALERVTGEKTLGYMSQGPRPTPHTLDLCAEQGVVWTADYSDADVPYTIDVNGHKLVSVGYTMPGYTDNDLAALGVVAGLAQLKITFDALYEESARHPMKLCYVAHVHNSGRPAMAKLLDDFLAYSASRPGVWFYRCIDLARYWLEHDQA
ncbi:MAG TPA: polysaccharide deacetylase family protein [Chloroflexota bacterium]|nr:polysaccharide deacetylase family protein [Chloroflexota bacterium]